MSTSSLAFPNMINVAGNRVSVKTGSDSIVNRTRLLILANPTELYNSPRFGVGISRYLWQYATANTTAQIRDRIINQLREYEPSVVADKTSFADGLIFSPDSSPQQYNQLKLTVGLQSIYGDDLTISVADV